MEATMTRKERQAAAARAQTLRLFVGGCARIQEVIGEAAPAPRRDGRLQMPKAVWDDLFNVEDQWYETRTTGSADEAALVDLHFSVVAAQMMDLGFSKELWDEVWPEMAARIRLSRSHRMVRSA
jgi:hypothetical protein